MLPRSATAVTPKSATTRSFLTAHDAEAPSDPRPRALTRFAQTCALVPHRGRSIRPAPSVSSSEPVRLDVQTSSSLHQKTLSWRVFVAVNLTVAVRFGCGWWRWRCLGRFRCAFLFLLLVVPTPFQIGVLEIVSAPIFAVR
uniref:(northern house mosquito) hypothetical protein n=1 Tax=Culex pipiens TaxID=7175 RepID=A0A8D8KJY7_CULPI